MNNNPLGNNVIGPIPLDSWYTMRMLRESIKHTACINPKKYAMMIDQHKRWYRDEMRQYL